MSAPPPNRLTLAELVELEARLALDAEAAPAEVRARDAALRGALAPIPEGRVALLRAWLGALPATGLGVRFARAARVTRAGLWLLGLLFGVSTAAVALRYDGQTPVNVAWALLFLVVPQLVLLLGLLLLALAVRLGVSLPLLGDFQHFARWALGRLAVGAHKKAPSAWVTAWHRLRTRRSLYHRVERWLVFGLLQGFGVAFNLAALTTALVLVVFSDLAFGWGTTLAADPASFHAVLEAVALPWRWAWPGALPSVEVVDATRYVRLGEGYVGMARALSPEVAGAWWRFIVAALLVYGLIPRLVFAVVAARRQRAAFEELPLDTPDLERVALTLRGASVRTRAPQVELEQPGPGPAPEAAPIDATTPGCLAILWRGVPAREDALAGAVEAHLGAALTATVEVPDFAAEADAQAAAEASADSLLVLAEAWEAPDKATRRFIRALRASAGRDRRLIVGLVGAADGYGWRAADPADVRVWRDHLATLEDPYLGVEPLEPPL